jgi:phage shock protein PspC (stress-responsive transcriptional regulator)
MHKVITINLNGVAFQLDEPAYEAMRAYLDRAARQLEGNPDVAEIMADLEQAIAEKCSRFLNDHKSVVTASEVEQVIAEMGPVDSGVGSDSSGSKGEPGDKTHTDAHAPKRLYNLREGAMISGVCNGLAAYFNIDVTIVRIIFVVLAILTKGAWILAYVVLMFVVPYANTSEERAAAHGLPFNAQELVDQAKKNFEAFKNDKEWQRRMAGPAAADFARNLKYQKRHWRWHWRQARREQRRWGPYVRPPVGYAAQVWAGITVPVFGIISAGLFLLLAYSIVSLVNTERIFGWSLPPGIPIWGGILMLVVLYAFLASPLHAVRHASYYAYGGANYPWFALWGSMLWLGFTMLFIWLAYTHLPDFKEFMRNLPGVWESFRDAVMRPR